MRATLVNRIPAAKRGLVRLHRAQPPISAVAKVPNSHGCYSFRPGAIAHAPAPRHDVGDALRSVLLRFLSCFV